MRQYIVSLLALCISFVALAVTVSGHSSAADVATRIEVDQQANIIRILIDGREIARLDADGLHVRENINYGATITDYGCIGFDRHVSKSGEDGDAQ